MQGTGSSQLPTRMTNQRFWYTISTETEFHHIALAIVSAIALRRVAPNASVSIAMDAATVSLAQHESADLSSVFDEVLVMDAPEYTPMLRSRSLKMRLREEIRGDFVFLDTDVLIADPTGWKWPEADVSMALDAPLGTPGKVPRRLAGQFEANGWSYPVAAYFNSGLILWRDTPNARQFAQQWLDCWRHSVSNGIPFDQPALSQANELCNQQVGVLPPSYNAPVFLSASEVRTAKVWHFWPFKGRDSSHKQSVLHVLLEEYLKSRSFNSVAFEGALRTRYPWNASMGARFLLRNGYYRMGMQAVGRRLLGKRPARPWRGDY